MPKSRRDVVWWDAAADPVGRLARDPLSLALRRLRRKQGEFRTEEKMAQWREQLAHARALLAAAGRGRNAATHGAAAKPRPRRMLPPTLYEVRALGRETSLIAMDALAQIVEDPRHISAVRRAAAKALLDRGFGRPSPGLNFAVQQIAAGPRSPGRAMALALTDPSAGATQMFDALLDRIAPGLPPTVRSLTRTAAPWSRPRLERKGKAAASSSQDRAKNHQPKRKPR